METNKSVFLQSRYAFEFLKDIARVRVGCIRVD
jgi:hypothetical protein